MTIDPEKDTLPENTRLGVLLAAAAPAVSTPSPAREAALVELVGTTRHQAGRRTSTTRRASVAIVLGAVVVGAGAAAAAADVWHAPWMKAPAIEVQYSITSTGQRCALTLGDLEGSAKAVSAAKKYLKTVDVLTTADVDRVLASMQAKGAFAQGSPVDQLASHQYAAAVAYATSELVDAELVRQGFPAHAVSGGSYTSSCAGDAS